MGQSKSLYIDDDNFAQFVDDVHEYFSCYEDTENQDDETWEEIATIFNTHETWSAYKTKHPKTWKGRIRRALLKSEEADRGDDIVSKNIRDLMRLKWIGTWKIAKAIGLEDGQFNARMRGVHPWEQHEIKLAADFLEVGELELKVSKNLVKKYAFDKEANNTAVDLGKAELKVEDGTPILCKEHQHITTLRRITNAEAQIVLDTHDLRRVCRTLLNGTSEELSHGNREIFMFAKLVNAHCEQVLGYMVKQQQGNQ